MDFKKDIAELQNEVRSVMLLALDYRNQLKKLSSYLEEDVQATPKKMLHEGLFGNRK